VSTLLKLLGYLPKLINLLTFLIGEGKKQLEELAARRRVEKVERAVEQARKAKTLEEKRKAACELEKTFNPSAKCDPADGSK